MRSLATLRKVGRDQDRIVEMERAFADAPNRRASPRPLNKETALALWIILSTCCRVGELTVARWEHVNFETGEWLVPKANAKTGNEWLVQLSNFALRHFKALHELTGQSEWCFPATSKEGPLCTATISKQVGDRQVQFKKRKTMSKRRNDNTLVLAGGKHGEWTPHDLRRTGSTLMQRLGVPEHVRERCLNHIVGGKIGRVYGRHDFASEKRDAWAFLGNRLDVILGNTNVIRLPVRA